MRDAMPCSLWSVSPAKMILTHLIWIASARRIAQAEVTDTATAVQDRTAANGKMAASTATAA
jgi:hypothetical protein